MEKMMFEVLTDEEIDCVFGGMGNGGGGPMKVSQLDKGSGHSACTEGILGGMIAAGFGGLATGNLIGFAGVTAGAILGTAMGAGCFRNPPPKIMQQ